MSLRPILATSVILLACSVSGPAMSSPRSPPSDESAALATKYPPESILGEWWTERQEGRPPARVRFVHAQDGTYLGILSWSPAPRKDVNNKDPKLRDRPVVGMILMWHLRYDSGEYVDGYVYNPEDGGTYRMKAEVLGPGTLKVRGYLGFALFGQNQTWTRTQPS